MLNIVTAVQAREQGIAAADMGTSEQWKAKAIEAVKVIASKQRRLTSEDVWELLIDKPREHRSMGPIMRIAQKMGIISPLNEWFLAEDPVRHRRPLRIWESLGVVNGT